MGQSDSNAAQWSTADAGAEAMNDRQLITAETTSGAIGGARGLVPVGFEPNLAVLSVGPFPSS